MSEERYTDAQSGDAQTGTIWFRATPEIEACFHEVLSLAAEQGWHSEVTLTGIEVRRPGSRVRLTIATRRALEDAPRRALASFRELCERMAADANADESASYDFGDYLRPTAGRGIVVGAPGFEHSPFSGSHISERSG